ncbi:hypothetical protein [Lentibacillus sp. CBA3610]|uniref:hypothetical protein n=1 Tax=Lentibacillus sp. CBA3610 TaxID=2518176 RepID=UPI001595A1C7|nr:hypothetical protein [Lentibacillus sp. CBA3610]QKY70349.1 hypothetical protein Len3610_12755 [Lentibacillus sp. CBA3610]
MKSDYLTKPFTAVFVMTTLTILLIVANVFSPYNVKAADENSEQVSPPDTDPVSNTLSSDFMSIEIDEVFPRIMKYDVDGKIMRGQEKSVYGLYINNELYYPDVEFEKVNDSEAIYPGFPPTHNEVGGVTPNFP